MGIWKEVGSLNREITLIKTFLVLHSEGISEEQSEFIDQFFCKKCIELSERSSTEPSSSVDSATSIKTLQLTWLNPCRLCGKPCKDDKKGKKYCSETCGLEVAKKRLANLFHSNSFKSVNFSIKQAREIPETCDRIVKEKKKLNGKLTEFSQKLSNLEQRKRAIWEAVAIADTLSAILDSLEKESSDETQEQSFGICGFSIGLLGYKEYESKHQSVHIESLLSNVEAILGDEEPSTQQSKILDYLSAAVCTRSRRGCKLHNHSNQLKRTFEPPALKVDIPHKLKSLIPGNTPAYKLPGWAGTYLTLMDIEREEIEQSHEFQLKKQLQNLEFEESQEICCIDFEGKNDGDRSFFKAKIIGTPVYSRDEFDQPAEIESVAFGCTL